MDSPLYSIVVPVFNEEAVLERFIGELMGELGALEAPYEVLFVDDGSTDGTWNILEKAAARHAPLQAYRLSRNFGHKAALFTGLYKARGKAVGLMDGDGQDPPRAMVEMLRKWDEGYTVVYGVRKNRKEGFLKRAAYKAFYRLMKRIASIDLPLDSGDFSVMDRKVVDFILSLEDKNPYIRGWRSWYGGRQLAYEYERDARWAGKSKYSWMQLILLATSGITSFSKLPLRLSVTAGTITAAGALVYAVFVILRKMIFDYPPDVRVIGWSSLASLFTFLMGITMLMIGIVGEYISNIFESVKKIPVSIIFDSTEKESAAEAVSGRPEATDKDQ